MKNHISKSHKQFNELRQLILDSKITFCNSDEEKIHLEKRHLAKINYAIEKYRNIIQLLNVVDELEQTFNSYKQ